MRRVGALLTCMLMGLSTISQAETTLLMIEEEGCVWCARWDEEIAPIYPKTAEGKLAPLQRHDIHEPVTHATLQRGVFFTPTFILLEDGVETGRIEGYPGEDFFWGLLADMIKQTLTEPDTSGS